MKRFLTVLILVMSGSLLIAVSLMPGDTYAADPTEQYLETDVKDDDLTVSLTGTNGDSDSVTGGLEDLDFKTSNGLDDDGALNTIEGLTLEDLMIFVAMTIQILP